MPKRKAQTVHGEVEYETVQCTSCNDEIAKEDAYEFTIRSKSVTGPFRSRVSREGYACKYCANEGPIRYPSGTYKGYVTAVLTALFWDEQLDMIHPIKATLVATVLFLLVIVI